jgi:hypothetical protein
MADTSSDLPQSQNIVPRLGAPGTPDFFASLLDFIRVTAPGVPLDPVIFQAIVLCVMAGNKHVLLRPREEDVPIVQNLAALVRNFVFVSTTELPRGVGQLDGWRLLAVASPPFHSLSCFLYEVYSLFPSGICQHIWLCNPQA